MSKFPKRNRYGIEREADGFDNAVIGVLVAYIVCALLAVFVTTVYLMLKAGN